eukprot:evm.model.scf_1944.3 EVM.evm.TU.scf_1944.3   scf_1944:20345-21967(+)
MEKAQTWRPVLDADSSTLRLNVGGRVFEMDKADIDRFPDSLIADIVDKCADAFTREHPLCVDRDPERVDAILHVHRTGFLDPSHVHKYTHAPYTAESLCEDLDFYRLPTWDKLVRDKDGRFLRLQIELQLQPIVERMVGKLEGMGTCVVLRNSLSFVVHMEEDDELAVALLSSVTKVHESWEGEAKVHVRDAGAVKVRTIATLGPTSQEILLELCRRKGFSSEVRDTNLPPCQGTNEEQSPRIQVVVLKW